MRIIIVIIFLFFANIANAQGNGAQGNGAQGNGAQENSAQSGKSFKPLNAERFMQILPGNTLLGEYRFLRERSNTYNFTEKHYADGTTDYREGDIREKGIWYTLGNNKICYKYPESKEMGGYISCFWVYEHDKCFYGYSISEMTLNGPRNFNDWVARWIIKGSGGSCDEAVG